MGASRSRDEAGSMVPTGEHSALPADNIPYKGPSLQCAFVDLQVIASTFMGTARYMKTDMTPHYEAFAGPYGAGFTAVLLKTIPGARKKLHVQYGMERRYYIAFQAVFMKAANAPVEPAGSLKMMKASISFRDFVAPTSQPGVDAANEVAHLLEFDRKIEEGAHGGYRLVSFEYTGFNKEKRGKDDKDTVMQVEMMFHRSLNPGATGPCTYRSTVVPITYTAVRRLPVSRRPVYALTTDITAHVTGMLREGWKIVDVTYLSSHLQGAFNPRADTITLNTLWVFEMPPSPGNHPWECAVVKYSHTLKLVMNGRKAATTWNPVVMEMARRGWELACILDTAESSPRGSSGAQTLLLIFQRPVL